MIPPRIRVVRLQSRNPLVGIALLLLVLALLAAVVVFGMALLAGAAVLGGAVYLGRRLVGRPVLGERGGAGRLPGVEAAVGRLDPSREVFAPGDGAPGGRRLPSGEG